MSRKGKKSHLGKRLWHSITEPIPDDNDEQNNEQIPLAYDLKDAATSDQASDPASKSTVNPPRRSAASAADKPVAAVIEPDKIVKHSAASAASTAPEKRVPDSTPAPESAPASAASAASATSTVASEAATRVPDSATRSKRHSQPSQAAPTSQQSVPDSAMAATEPATSSAATRQPVTQATSAEPRVTVQGTEAGEHDDTDPLPLSREELYGDQQPNGGQEPESEPEPVTTSRMARHGVTETASSATEDEPVSEHGNDNPHLKKSSHHYNWKLMVSGIVILLVAAVGGLFMWNHAKTTQAAARTNAENVVAAIYTSSAQRDLRKDASEDQLTQLQSNIDAMKDSSEKTSLQRQHDYAAKMMKVRSRYQNLRNTSGLINTNVTTSMIKADRQAIKTAGLTSKKAYFAKKYDTKFAATGKTVKKVAGYHRDFKGLYTSKNKLKSTTASSHVDTVMKHLKAYRKQSQLAANDYTQLKADRKKLAKKIAASAASEASAESSSVVSYSEPESSSSSIYYSSSDETSSSDDSDSTGTSYGTGNDTATSSADQSSTTTNDQDTTSDNSTTSDGTGTTTGDTTGDTTSSTADSQSTGTTTDTTTNGTN